MAFGKWVLEIVPLSGSEDVFKTKAWSFTSLFSAPIQLNYQELVTQ